MKKIEKSVEKGEFKTKLKFLEFIGGKGFINFHSSEAYIDGKQLSGLDMDEIKFKLTIFEDGTVNFHEVDSNFTTKSQRMRLIEIIEEKTLNVFRGKTVIQDLNFISTTKIKEKNVPLYLCVEIEKPIEKLASIFENSVEISTQTMGKLDDLLGLFDDQISEEPTTPLVEPPSLPLEPKNFSVNQIENSFTKMKSEKLIELKSQKIKKDTELHRLEIQTQMNQKQIENLKSEIKLLEDRIDDIMPQDNFNGYYFNVSERTNEVIILEPEIEMIIKEKVSKIKSINVENFMKLFIDGEFVITLGVLENDKISKINDPKTLDRDILDKLNTMELKIYDNKLIYTGELTWGQIVNKLIKFGFAQNDEFDKMCGSNSHQSKTESKKDVSQLNQTF